MSIPVDEESREIGGPGNCAECGTALTGGQRYCLECGARTGPLPPAVAQSLPSMLARKRGGEEGVPSSDAADSQEAEPGDGAVAADADDAPGGDGQAAAAAAFMPSPRTAAIAVLGMLGLGVLLGSATSQLAQSAGLSSILLEASSPPAEASAPEEEPEFEAAFSETAAPESGPATTSSGPSEEAVEEAPPKAPEEPKLPEEFPEEPALPPVKHVFVIMLGENGFEETFGKTATAPYLAKTLPEQGELLPNYFAVSKGQLANQIALISGQGPTLETAANCPNFTDLAPATESTAGQVEGAGCVYPASTPTLLSELTKKKLSWKAYVEDIGSGAAAGLPATCRHPAVGTPDLGPSQLPGDRYRTWRNPFVYFHAVIDDPACGETDVGLDRLALDLKTAKTTPQLSYIVPNVCNAGGPEPCEEGAPAGPAAAEAFLRTVVPQIQASPAYKKEGGLIAITSTQAPQAGEAPDTSACCVTPAYPNLPAETTPPSSGPVKATGGGGKVGLLLLSPFVKPGSVEESAYFNHYSLLLSIEELFALELVGYASDPGAVGFGATVYNNAE